MPNKHFATSATAMYSVLSGVTGGMGMAAIFHMAGREPNPALCLGTTFAAATFPLLPKIFHRSNVAIVTRSSEMTDAKATTILSFALASAGGLAGGITEGSLIGIILGTLGAAIPWIPGVSKKDERNTSSISSHSDVPPKYII